MYGICEKCYEPLDLSAHRNIYWDAFICRHCKKIVKGIELDELIIPIISILNKKGYKTKYCCSGHGLDSLVSMKRKSADLINNWYIMFDGLYKYKELNLDSLKLDGVNIEFENFDGDTIIRHRFIDELENFYIALGFVSSLNITMYDWANSLPERTFE